MNAAPESRRDTVPVLLLILLTLALYGNTLFFQFALDDGVVYTDNAIVLRGVAGWPELFSRDTFYGVFREKTPLLLSGGRYRPFTPAMFAAEYEWFGLNPMVSHLVNVALYALLNVLLYRLLRRLLPEPGGRWCLSVPFLAALLFAVHPLHTEVVANIKGRDEIMSLLGSVAALLLSLKYVEDRRSPRLVFSFLVFFAALLSKENALTFLAVVPLTLFVFTRAPREVYRPVMTPLLLASALYLLLRFWAIGLTGGIVARELMNNPFLFATSPERFATVLYTWGRYLCLLVFPHPLTHDYYPRHIPLIGLGDPRFLASFAVVVLLLGAALAGLRRRSVPAYAVAFFALTFLPQSNFLFNVGTFMNERFVFAPSAGFALFAAWAACAACRRFPAAARSPAVPLAWLAVLGVFSWITFNRNFAWRDSYTLSLTDIGVSANSAKCNLTAGAHTIGSITPDMPVRERSRRLRTAEGYLRRAIEIHPDYIDGWVWMGYLQREQGLREDSRASFERALELDPRNEDALRYARLDAAAFIERGELEQAVPYLEMLVSHVPEDPVFPYLLAEACEKIGRPKKSIEVLEDFARQHPEDPRACAELARLYKKTGDRKKAREYAEKARELQPAR